ncbi:DUF3881 family protein [Ruminococcus gauvreauii]|uniref:DUF3881 family protein n=1 Tax=Ruminococcus gauvreauii TaxID=438033 RepID=A0ABY5VMH5_9FIRM|nr:DUF3881 family protein [Ruminococcus gauvreauii]UWP61146.1 DUF3881 family protein [Ruminococcus gauvreauii]
MHSYLKAIGFSEIDSKKELNNILDMVISNYDEKMVVEHDGNHLFAEMSKSFGYDCGITVCGEYDENNEFQMEYYYPYFHGTDVSTKEGVIIEKHAGKESFAGACDDVRIGVTLIFYLLNAGEYLNEKEKGFLAGTDTTVTLSGLALEGKILLPVKKDSQQVEEDKKTMTNRNHLIAAARNGDEEAMESLTMEDIDTYTMISRRIQQEDVFTIVDSYFMPYGVECDQYNVMGNIVDFVESTNVLTKEKMYQISLNCNDIKFDVCINQKDLMGEPEIGRRFKAVIWLQGFLNF